MSENLIEENEFNLSDEVIEEIPQIITDENQEVSYACEDCGYPIKEGWRACPQCGKVTKPFDTWEILASVKGAPSREKIEQLKTEKGLDIRIAIADEDRIYLITPIMRDRWKQFNTMTKGIKEESDRQEKLSELIVNNCVIWPKPDSPLFGNRAGTYSTLFEQIMHISDFIPPQVAIQMVYKL